VTIVEVDPIRAIEALMDGYGVMSSLDAAAWGDLFITATGNFHIFGREHFERMRDGAMMANSGHFDDEYDLPVLGELCSNRIREVRPDVQEYDFGDRKLYVLGEGRLVNLAAAEGHPASVMDMSFANQALAVEHLVRNHSDMSAQMYTVPAEIDREVARLKLAALGVTIDEMTPQQLKYSTSWQEGT
jgi:adenosylhomocysteinase